MNSSTRQPWAIATAIVLGCLILGLLLGQRSPAQNAQPQPQPEAQTPNPTAAPKFQIVACTHEQSRDVIVIMETATGHCWGTVAAQENKWFDMGTPGPVKAKKKKEGAAREAPK